MDPVGVTGLVVGIVTLYSTCRDCYIFFTNAKNAETQSELHLREFEIQHSILKAWGFYWEILRHEITVATVPIESSPKNSKLFRFLSRNVFKAEGVFQTLSALADTLSDHDKLIRRYGLQLKAIETDALKDRPRQLAIASVTEDDIQPIATEIRARLSILTKCRWALKDKDRFKKLIVDLKSFNDALYRLCPEGALDAMNIFLTLDCLAHQESPINLMRTSTLAEQLARGDESFLMRPGFDLLASAANFKARIIRRQTREPSVNNEHSPKLSDPSDLFRLGKRLGVFENQVVYIENRVYREAAAEKMRQEMKERISRHRETYGWETRTVTPKRLSSETPEGATDEIPSPQPDDVLRSRIMDFYDALHNSTMSTNILCLDPIGIIDNLQGKYQYYCSILYKLPGNLGVPSRFRPAEDLVLRAPVTLRALFYQRETYLEKVALGARFQMARKIVHAVCLLHASGWLHKNIHAESVLFFPELASDIDVNDRTNDQDHPIDISNPVIMGYLFSRPDDVRHEPTVSLGRNHPFTGTERSKSASYIQQTYETITDSFSYPNKPYRAPDFARSHYYQHPAKNTNPARLYRHAYDVYSLGILLLEIGLWSRIDTYRSGMRPPPPRPNPKFESEVDSDSSDTPIVSTDHYENRRQLCRNMIPELRFLCGDRYADIVLDCLMVDTTDDEVSKASQRELCARIAANLEDCQA